MPAPSMDFDSARLDRFLRSQVADLEGAMEIEKVAGGQSNPTYFVSYGPRRLVLRKKPAGPLLPSAHAVDREYRVLSALRPTGVPVPAPVLYCGDDDVVGTPFYLMERVDGHVFTQCRLPQVAPAQRTAYYHAAARTLAALHAVDPKAAGLGDFGKTGSYNARQITRWKRQWELSRTQDNADVDALSQWLEANIPADETTTLVHGDYRIGNLIFALDEPRVAAILDWELSTLGHPLADVAHFCVYSWFMTEAEFGGLRDIDRPAEGLPELSDFTDAYATAAGRPLRPSIFDLALALFRNTVIFEGIAARAKAGNAAAANAEAVGKLAPVLARRALELISSSPRI